VTASLALSPGLDLTARLGYADVTSEDQADQEAGGTLDDETGMSGLTPGLGLIWQPAGPVRVRAAAGRTIKRPFVANQTIQPTQLAGFNEQFDDLDATRADWLGLAVDLRASDSVRVGAEAVLRRLSREVVDPDGNRNDSQDDDRALAYLYWTPTDRIAASLEVIGEDFSADKSDDPVPHKVRTLTTPLQLTYAAPAGWFTTGRVAFVAQDVDQPEDGQNRDHNSHGVLVDLTAGYRLPKRLGIVALQVTNLLDQDLAFQDESFRTSRGRVNPRFVPSRMFLATLTLNF
jgi:outer membrane receptor protein involved in Fe transport